MAGRNKKKHEFCTKLESSDECVARVSSGPVTSVLNTTSDDGDGFMGFDPMSDDYESTNAFRNWIISGSHNGKLACKFHDGLSGSCWKGSGCHYNHNIYSGGVFAERNPVWSAAADYERAVTATLNLGPETVLNNEDHAKCTIIHVESPSEFYIRLIQDPIDCSCKTVGMTDANKGNQTDNMDDYFFGFNSLKDAPEDLNCEQTQPAHSRRTSLHEMLNKYLSSIGCKKFQSGIYFEQTELVAVKVRLQWHRALVRKCNVDGTFLVILLDIGETLTVEAKDICGLPYKFSIFPPEVYKYCLHGVSPIFRRWDSVATKTFKDIVKDKDIMIVVQKGITTGNFSIFEEFPYYVKMLASSDQEDINVSKKLVDLGVALRWSRQ